MAIKISNVLDLAKLFAGEAEIPGEKDNPFILWCLASCPNYETPHDEEAWCSAFANRIHALAKLPRSKSLAARSWLLVGKSVALKDARPGDIMVLKRGSGSQPGKDVINAPGHVTFFESHASGMPVFIGYGGNQGNTVKSSNFPISDILDVRRCE